MGGMGEKVHKVRPLNGEAKKKVLPNVVITKDGSKEGMLLLEDQASYCGRGAFSQTITSYWFGNSHWFGNSRLATKEVVYSRDLGCSS
jgi:hypothetical protein